MQLTPREKDKLLVAMAAIVARRRLERGVKLNHPEAIALITDFVVEGARDGRSVADLMEAGAHVLTPRAGDGGHCRDDPRRAGGSDLPRRHQARHRSPSDPLRREHMIPGEIFTRDGDIELNARRLAASRSPLPIPATGRSRSARTIISSKPIAALSSIASKARGFRLDIAAGTAVRFEPGQTREVTLVALAEARKCTASAAM